MGKHGLCNYKTSEGVSVSFTVATPLFLNKLGMPVWISHSARHMMDKIAHQGLVPFLQPIYQVLIQLHFLCVFDMSC